MIVVGPPGSGKSTVARSLAGHLSIPHVELDRLFWKRGWQRASADELQAALSAAISGDRWVIDGNYYSATSSVSWARADLVVWLDLPRWRTVSRVARRTLIQFVSRRELWHGNRQTVGQGVALFRFAWRDYGKYRARYGPLSIAGGLPARWLRLDSPVAVRRWIRSVARSGRI